MNNSSVFSRGFVQIEPVAGLHGIGGELDVPCTTNRLYGGPNAFGRRKRPFGFHTRTLMSRPHMTRVPRTVPGGEQQLDNRGNRSGRERSSPTWGHECCGVTGWGSVWAWPEGTSVHLRPSHFLSKYQRQRRQPIRVLRNQVLLPKAILLSFLAQLRTPVIRAWSLL